MSTQHIDRITSCPADNLAHVPPASIDAWITSIPFEMMRRYSDDPRDIGNYQGSAFINRLGPVLDEWRRTLKPTGNLLINFAAQTSDGRLSPSAYLLPKAIVDHGFTLVQELTVIKTNSMPTNDARLLKRTTEKVFHAVLDPAKFIVNKSTVLRPHYWAGRDQRPKYSSLGADPGAVICPAIERLRHLSEKDVLLALLGDGADALAVAKTQTQATGHPGKMADEVARWLIAYGSPPEGTVGDNFCGGGTTLVQARALGRHYVGSDLNDEYVDQAVTAVNSVAFGERLSPGFGCRSVDTGRPRGAARPQAKAKTGRCRHCRRDFLIKKRWQQFCSNDCRYQFNNGRRRSRADEAADA